MATTMRTNDLHVVVGLGLTGLSCLAYLKQQNIPIALMDTREQPPNLDQFQRLYPNTPSVLGTLDHPLLDKAGVIVLSPGVSRKEPAIAKQAQRGVPIIGDIELFARAVQAPVIGITGTNAKSTVTTLVGKMAEAAQYNVQTGGNLGIPALSLWMDNSNANLFVLELSSFQLETTHSLQPAVASILNITPDHMDRYAQLSDYQQAKQRVYTNCHTAVCNRDDQLTECFSAQEKYYFTLQKPSTNQFGLLQIRGKKYLSFADEPLLGVEELPLSGTHYQANALAALAIGHGFGLDFEPMLDVLRTFKGLPHRCQLVRELKGVKWYNDSKGTNVGATQAAIQGLGDDTGKLVLIAGGIGKQADFTPLLPLVQKYARHVVLIGEAADELGKIFQPSVKVTFANTMEDAVAAAAAVAQPQDKVLLSPACASFDMFKNFEHRGEVFTQIVNHL